MNKHHSTDGQPGRELSPEARLLIDMAIRSMSRRALPPAPKPEPMNSLPALGETLTYVHTAAPYPVLVIAVDEEDNLSPVLVRDESGGRLWTRPEHLERRAFAGVRP